MLDRLPYREIWAVDFEFQANPGERPDPICMVAQELRSGRKLRLWEDRFRNLSQPPFAIDDDSLFVSFSAAAELGCFLSLGWPMARRILDLYVEYRNSTNTLQLKGSPPIETSLLAALVTHGLPRMDLVEKDE